MTYGGADDTPVVAVLNHQHQYHDENMEVVDCRFDLGSMG